MKVKHSQVYMRENIQEEFFGFFILADFWQQLLDF